MPLTAERTRAPVTLTVGANATISVLWEALWFDLAEGNQGTFLSSENEFWGVSVIDSATVQGTGDDWDWGYSLVPESELSSQLIVGHAPGKPAGVGEIPDDNGNLAFVVAVTDTVLYVDLDQDGPLFVNRCRDIHCSLSYSSLHQGQLVASLGCDAVYHFVHDLPDQVNAQSARSALFQWQGQIRRWVAVGIKG